MLFALFAFQEAGGHELFQNPGAGGRGSQALALGVLRHLVLPGSLHRGEQRILGVVLGRGGLALLDGGTGDRQALALGQFWQTASVRQGFVLGFLVRLRIFQPSAVGRVQRPPTGLLHRAALGGKFRSGALHHHGGFRIGMRFRHSAQQPQGHQLQHRPFTHRQSGQVRLLDIPGGDNGMVVGHFLVVDDRRRITGNGDALAERHGVGNQICR